MPQQRTSRASERTAPPWLAGLGEAATVRLVAGLLVTATIAAYANSFGGPFVFDDVPAIVENASIRSFSPWWQPLVPPLESGSTVGRPVVNLSFALNHAVGGLDPWGYHLVNLAIHAAAGLVLFGIVRRTLALPWATEWLRTRAVALGGGTALLWLLHPLQTESVTSIVQRTESLGGLFYLLTVYGFVRGAGAASVPGSGFGVPGLESGGSRVPAGQLGTRNPKPGTARRSARRWLVLSGVACFVGVATKEIVATAPLILLIHDRTFVAGSFAAAWRARRGFYLTLTMSWVVLAVLMASAQGRGGTVTLGRDIGVWTTLLTQAKAIAVYLKLSLWPHPLVLDYGSYASDAVRSVREVWAQGIAVVSLLVATVVALVKRPVIGFVGAWFFAILAPSSSFIPLLSQARAEHRMYLPLAAIVVLAVVVGARWLGRGAPWAAAGVALALGITTAVRNRDYASALTLWTATAEAFPSNPRAHYNLANERRDTGDADGAVSAYREALRLAPADLRSHVNLATLLATEGRLAEARVHADVAVRLDAKSERARNILGRVLFQQGELDGAERELREALRLRADDGAVHKNLALVLAARGDLAGAIEPLQRAVRLQPRADTWQMLGEMLRQTNRLGEARASFEAALALEPERAMARFHLADLLVLAGEVEAAVPHYEAAVRGLPRTLPPLFNLGMALRKLGRNEEAMRAFEAVLRIEPNDREAREIVRELRAGGR